MTGMPEENSEIRTPKSEMPRRSGFLSRPSGKRLLVLLVLGALAIAAAWAWRVSRRPEEVPPEVAARALARVREVLEVVRESEFGRTERGQALSARLDEFLARGGVRFSSSLGSEALYRKEFGCAPLLYIRTPRAPGGHFLPEPGEFAERTYHETLHAVKDSDTKSWEEECDAFCAAEQARAAVEKRPPRYPVKRDGEVLWQWVKSAYPELRSDPSYQPVGQTLKELGEKAGRPDAGKSCAPSDRR